MADEWLVARLKEIPLFARLSEDELRQVANMGRIIHRPAGDFIVRQGEPGDAFYVLLSGRAAVYATDERGVEKLLNYLSANEFFGEMALLSKKPRMASVQLLEDAELLQFDQSVFEQLLRSSPEIRSYLIRTRIDFPGKQWDEIAEVYERKHVYGFVEALFFGPLFPLLAVLTIVGATFVTNKNLLRIVGPIGLAVTALIALWIVALYIDWHDDYYIVTTKRVIHVERTMLIREERREAPIEQVLTVTTRIPNVIARLLGFRDLVIRTASVGEPITFRRLADAEQVQEVIMRMKEKALSRRVAEEKSERIRRLKQQLGFPVDEPPAEPESPPPGPPPPPRGSWLGRLWRYVIPRMRLETANSVTWRKHWTILLAKTGPSLVLTLSAFLLAIAIFVGLLPLPKPLVSWRPGLGIVAVLLFFAALSRLIWRYEDWQNDIYVVTDTDIIDRESAPFGLREKKRIGSLADIESVYSDVPNLWARLLNYGNVFIDTAGTPKAYTFESVHDPIAVQQEVFARLTAFRERRRREQSQRQAEQLAEWLGDYHRLVSQSQLNPTASGESVAPPRIA